MKRLKVVAVGGLLAITLTWCGVWLWQSTRWSNRFLASDDPVVTEAPLKRADLVNVQYPSADVHGKLPLVLKLPSIWYTINVPQSCSSVCVSQQAGAVSLCGQGERSTSFQLDGAYSLLHENYEWAQGEMNKQLGPGHELEVSQAMRRFLGSTQEQQFLMCLEGSEASLEMAGSDEEKAAISLVGLSVRRGLGILGPKVQVTQAGPHKCYWWPVDKGSVQGLVFDKDGETLAFVQTSKSGIPITLETAGLIVVVPAYEPEVQVEPSIAAHPTADAEGKLTLLLKYSNWYTIDLPQSCRSVCISREARLLTVSSGDQDASFRFDGAYSLLRDQYQSAQEKMNTRLGPGHDLEVAEAMQRFFTSTHEQQFLMCLESSEMPLKTHDGDNEQTAILLAGQSIRPAFGIHGQQVQLTQAGPHKFYWWGDKGGSWVHGFAFDKDGETLAFVKTSRPAMPLALETAGAISVVLKYEPEVLVEPYPMD